MKVVLQISSITFRVSHHLKNIIALICNYFIRLPMCLAEASSEEYTVPEAKRSCKDVQRKPLMLAPTSTVGRMRRKIHYWMLYG